MAYSEDRKTVCLQKSSGLIARLTADKKRELKNVHEHCSIVRAEKIVIIITVFTEFSNAMSLSQSLLK